MELLVWFDLIWIDWLIWSEFDLLQKNFPTTYCWHKLICTSDASHLVFGNHLLDARLHLDVPLHEGHVADVDGEQDEGLPPEDAVIPEEVDQHQQTDAVERAVAEQRPPGERQDRLGEERAHSDHKQDVKHGGANDRTNAHIIERHENANHTGEELGGTATRRHKRRAGHIVRDAELFNDYVKGRHEEFITDNGQRHKHIDHPNDVQDDSAVLKLFFRE